MGKNIDKFILLMWKNWILQIRHPGMILFTIILPAVFCLLLVLVRGTIYKSEKFPSAFYPRFDPLTGIDEGFTTILYSPVNPNLASIMNRTAQLLNLKAQALPHAASMEKYVHENLRNGILGGVQFEDSLSGSVSLPQDMYVAVRFPGKLRKGGHRGDWKTHLLFPQMQSAGTRDPYENFTASPGYYQEGFLAIQLAFSRAFLESLGASLPTLQMQRFPYPEWTDTSLLPSFGEVAGLLLLISFLSSSTYITKSVALEKEKHIKAMLKIMGIPNWLHWISWFLEALTFLSISATLTTVFLTFVKTSNQVAVCDASNPLVIFVFLFLYNCSLITFSFMVSAFFTRANTAASFGGIAFFLTYIPFTFVSNRYRVLSLSTKLFACLGPNTALCLGFFLIMMKEATGEGVQFSNIWKTSLDDHLTLGAVLMMLITDSVLYMVITLYVDAFFPGNYGISQPWYIPFTLTFWRGGQYVQAESISNDIINCSSFEKEPTNLTIGIKMKNLRRTFGYKTAVADISLDMYENQITALLGLNGAGKTTAMSMLTGLIQPTSGTAYVKGYDIRTKMWKVRENLGLCLQHTILFDYLTVEEHIYFFSRLKGAKKEEVNSEIQRYAKPLELLPKLESKSKDLSRAMQRKLNVIIALCGNSKVVMLDEPTTGMDSSAKRALWDLLLKEKHGRTILLTTHFMEEADLLGDRIAIMAGGKIQCCGSSFFLKKKYGAGYHLILDKFENCVPSKVTSLLKQYIPSIEIESNIGSELTYVLSAKYVPVFEEMLHNLEENRDALGVSSYGISLTTLEQVFMRVGSEYNLEEAKRTPEAVYSKCNSTDDTTKVQIEYGVLYSGWKLYRNQMLAMFMKKFIYIVRSWTVFLIHLLMSGAVVIMTMASDNTEQFEWNSPKRELSLDSYDKPVTILSGFGPYKKAYLDILKEKNHLYEDIGHRNVIEYIIQKTVDETSTVRERYILATIFDNNSITALFNNLPYHSPPLALSMAINSVIRSKLKSSYSVRFINHPLQLRKSSGGNPWDLIYGTSFSMAVNVGTVMALVSAHYVLFYVKERIINAKHIQFLSGVGVPIFWGISFLMDICSFLVIVTMVLVTTVAFQVEGYKSFHDLGRFFLILLLFGYSMLPLHFLWSYLSNTPSSCYVIISMINIFTGAALFQVLFLLTGTKSMRRFAHKMHQVFLIFPHYSLCVGLQYSYEYNQCERIIDKCVEQIKKGVSECKKLACSMKHECCEFNGYFAWNFPGVGAIVVCFLVTGTIFFILLLALEYSPIQNLIDRIINMFKKTHLPPIPPDEDDDVSKERRKICNADDVTLMEYAVVLKDVTKYYTKCREYFLAVNRLCLGVENNECFGLLGVNGAGKTTTFKMITGHITISYGEVWVGGIDISKNLKNVQKLIGYSPQFDALLDDMTGYETLLMYCLIRGVSLPESRIVARQLAKALDFGKHLHERVKRYSGGNRKKLSTAIALIGDPPVLYFDEPTTGMDPATKRLIWNTLRKIRDSGKCIILTSHSIEECEALCTRTAIMVNGTFKCLGSVERLKSKFSEGVTLTIKAQKAADDETLKARVAAIEKFVLKNFPSAVLQDKHQEMLSYFVKEKKSLPWSRMFGIMEANKKRLDIEDYSLSQCSLEQGVLIRMGRNLDKFILLMWKNMILQIRNKRSTIFTIVLPIPICLLLLALKTAAYGMKKQPAIFYPTFDPITGLAEGFTTILYSPINPNLASIMNRTAQLLNLNAQGMSNAASMEKYVNQKLNLHNIIVGGVQFEDSLSGSISLPQDLYAAIRFPDELRKNGNNNWKTHLLFPQMQSAGPRDPKENFTASPGYYKEGFLAVQMALSRALMESFGASLPSLQMQRFPYPGWTDTSALLGFGTIIGLFLMFCFVNSNTYVTRSVALEKEKQIKEMLKIMGVPNWLHWTAWFLETLVLLSIPTLLTTILLTIAWLPKAKVAVCDTSSPVLIFVFLLLYMCSLITMAFMISAFFSKASTAASFGSVIFFLTYIPFLFITGSGYDALSLSTKLLSCLGSNTALCLGFFLIMIHEATGEGAHFNNIWKTTSPDDNLTLGAVMVMLIIDSVLYMVIALYIEAVFPGNYGIPQPWYFPCTTTFWCGERHSQVEDRSIETSTNDNSIEEEPSNLAIGIKMKNLRRTFGNKTAVAGVSLNMYENQITALLGHNGAGKTTTMSVLTGLIPPTSGTAYVRGHNIRTNLWKVRESLGLCPQHTVLFDDLTVEEHIYFFSRLKGVTKEQVNSEIQGYAKSLDLIPKLKDKAKNLSGGMQRKLNVIVALCGNSKVVMLDEPTAGMDPSARRELWDLLLKEKQGRTILLTTHFMEEADLLGDRIAIMAGGKIQCCGSSFFLKKKYGAGYRLIVEKSGSCVPSKVTNLLKEYIPTVQIESNIGSELTYVLKERYLPLFEPMLRDLEQHSSELGIRSYGISLTTLEQVFMRVGAAHDLEEAKRAPEAKHSNRKSVDNSAKLQIQHHELYSGCKLWRNQMLAMFLKKFVYILRSWILFVFHVGMTVVFVIFSMLAAYSGQSEKSAPERKLSLDSYDRPVTILSGSSPYKEAYLDILKEKNHLYEDISHGNMSEYIFQKRIDETLTVRERYILATIFDNNSITTLFNNLPYHSPPLALSMAVNSVIRSINNSVYNIHFSNYPLHFSKNSSGDTWQSISSGASFALALNLGLAMAFVSAYYALFYIKERVINAKHLQFLSGIGVPVFWGTAFLSDFLSFIIIAILVVVTTGAFQVEGYKSFDDLGRLFLLLLLFGYSMLPLHFLASYLSNTPSTFYGLMSTFNIFTGMVAFIILSALTAKESTRNAAHIVHELFLVFPHYCLCSGIQNSYEYGECNRIVDKCIGTMDVGESKCKEIACAIKYGCCDGGGPFAWNPPALGQILVSLLTNGTGFFILLLVLEYGPVRNLCCGIMSMCAKRRPPPVSPDEDHDVAKERRKIHDADNATLMQYAVFMRDVTKYYTKCCNHFLAVNRLCLGVKDYECFGLLGVNGAGKTTTFKMMTGHTRISYGKAWVGGISINKHLKKVQKLIGYCPQFDALLDDMTGYETLIMFCLIRGIGLSESKAAARQLAKDFDFDEHLHKRIKHYSGGNKRKLSTAIALIGDPPVLCFDEPTTGMDPATKRFVWNALCRVRDSGKCIILTSHNMEECEALCTRIAIMVNGSFKCLGSTQRLKSKFSEGFTLTIKVQKATDDKTLNERIAAVENFVLKTFPSAVLQEKHQEMLSYFIQEKKAMPWSKMFGIMEANKKRLNIEDYSLGQCSLEQVFLTFTKLQRSDT